MRIFLGPIHCKIQSKLVSTGLKESGHKVTIPRSPDQAAWDDLQKKLKRMDVIHLQAWDPSAHQISRYVAKKNKIRIMQYMGNEIRSRKLASLHNPYIHLIDDSLVDDEVQSERILKHAKCIPACIIPNFELLPYVFEHFSRIYVLPLGVEEALNHVAEAERHQNEIPKILHHSSDSDIKGTIYIEEALERLKNDGLMFEYQRLEPTRLNRLPKFFKRADIVIDQILIGSYTMDAILGMQLGKPVVSYVREDLKQHLPEKEPLLSANPANFEDLLRKLIIDKSYRQIIGKRAREYVKSNHSKQLLITRLNWIYSHEHMQTSDTKPQNESAKIFSFFNNSIHMYSKSKKSIKYLKKIKLKTT